MNRSTNLAASALVALSLTGVLLAVGHAQDGGQRPLPAPSSVSEEAGALGRRVGPRQPMSAEEKLIRNAYVKLMRYQSASLDDGAATSKKEIQPDDYLRFELRDIHTGPIAEISSRPLSELVTPLGGDIVTVKPNHRVWGNGPVHAYYEAEWGSASEGEQSEQRRTVGDMLLGAKKYTTYEVTVRLGGKQRFYQALALHHGTSETGNTGSEIIDNITSEMNRVLGEESPRVRSPWKTYVKTSLYLAVAREIRDKAKASHPLIPADAPIGYLPGDDLVSSAVAGGSVAIASLCATGVDRIQHRDGTTYVDTTGVLYVLKGTPVAFKAIASPSGATWPTGKPVWGGTSGAAGTGETTQVTFNTISSSTTDYKTVTAESGNVVTVNVIVYELMPQLTPQDDFSGRSTSDLGIGEIVDLAFTASPSLTTELIGGLQWVLGTGGPGQLVDNGNGTGKYTATEQTGSISLSLTVTGGVSAGQARTATRNIVAPSGAYLVQQPGSQIRHTQNTWSVGFLGNPYLLPMNVSFKALLFWEGGGGGVATGWLSDLHGYNHPPTSYKSVGNCTSTSGCQVFFSDNIYTGERAAPYGVGTFNWPIAWYYRVGEFGTAVNFFTANHYMTSSTNGKATIQKAGAGPFVKRPSDPTTSW